MPVKQLELFDPIVENVREKLLQRSLTGLKKYNTSLQTNNRDNYLNHLQDELLDGANYIEKLLVQRKDIQQLIRMYPNDALLGSVIKEIYA